ncbi:MAG TPA: zf-HC2 domain-containing protein [Bryobacteraceae bacterium]|nr:zf-HC2 domain-containing protein [Bryobacteraceae bacterium]
MHEQISFLAEGILTGKEREQVLTHLNACRACSVLQKQLEGVRRGLRKIESPRIPAGLAVQLRVLASHERVRQLARASFTARLEYWAGGLKLGFDNLMRPVALPIAGGLLSALLLFSVLVPNLSFRHVPTSEPPLALSSDPDGRIVDWSGVVPRLESVNAITEGDETVVELVIDDQGRVFDYSVQQGQLTPAMQQIILFSKFTPAMFFYQPAWGKIRVAFPARRTARG